MAPLDAARAATAREARPKVTGNGAADHAKPSWPEPEAQQRAVNINNPTKPEIRDPLDGLVEGPPPIPARRSRLKRWSGSLR
jgi:hypothetical protein